MNLDRVTKVLLVVCVVLLIPDLILAVWRLGLFPSPSMPVIAEIGAAEGTVAVLGSYIGFLS